MFECVRGVFGLYDGVAEEVGGVWKIVLFSPGVVSNVA